MGRAPCCDKANVKRGPWSPEEDSKLKDYIAKYGTGGNWIALPHKAGLKRCGKSCRLRWLNYLRPNIKHGDFTDEEDRVICTLFATIGSRWSIIASQLPGRTDNDIKNYWNTKLKKKLMAMAAAPAQYNSHHRKPPPTNNNQASSLVSSSPLSPTKNLITSYNYYYTPTKSFTPFEPNVPAVSEFSPLSNISSVTPESSQLLYSNNYPASLKDNQNCFSIYGGGSEPAGLCSINGRGHIKQEMVGFEQLQLQSFSSDNILGFEENQNFVLGGHATTSGEAESQTNINLNHWVEEEAAEVDDELGHFKQLINMTSNSFFNIDENKTKQEVLFLYN